MFDARHPREPLLRSEGGISQKGEDWPDRAPRSCLRLCQWRGCASSETAQRTDDRRRDGNRSSCGCRGRRDRSRWSGRVRRSPQSVQRISIKQVGLRIDSFIQRM
ncbi:unnamed protein product [Nippostrongylus brasiliensis]|uniref:Uncharacterized protein n=1 Tax=Nippostrongylus brasiliensis TaxID=27835 RepID=A0A0N4XMY5_NIPBR|nr:unnamed protein product [Nippostrongylus brasiliensis]